MKWIFTLLLTTFVVFANAQARLGYSFDEIENEFIEYKQFHKSTAEYNYLIVYRETLSNIYYFDNNNDCFKSIIIPNDDGVLHQMIEEYNSSFVIMSKSKWTYYTDGLIVNIQLIWDPEFRNYYFLWEF